MMLWEEKQTNGVFCRVSIAGIPRIFENNNLDHPGATKILLQVS
jgi:hypothetical protein